MNDDEWKKKRERAMAVTFQTGRPVFADTDGEMRYADGDREPLDAYGKSGTLAPESRLPYTRAMHATRAAFVSSIGASALNVIAGIWHPWCFVSAAMMLSSALIWRHVHRGQRALYGVRR